MPKFKIAAAASLAVLALQGCTASRYQISDALMRYGMNENKASCAAEFLRGNLSSGQVSRLSKAARYYDTGRALTFGDLVRVAGTIDDPQVTVQVAASALACGLLADMPMPRL